MTYFLVFFVLAVLAIAWFLHKVFGMSYWLTVILLLVSIVTNAIISDKNSHEETKTPELSSSQWNSETILDFSTGVCYQVDKTIAELKEDGLGISEGLILLRVKSQYSDSFIAELAQESGVRHLREVIEKDGKTSNESDRVSVNHLAKYDKEMKDSVRNFEDILLTVRSGAVAYRVNNGSCIGFENAAVKALSDNGLVKVE